MKNSPAVSVVIPAYNAEKYIGECLDSIFAQTFRDFEVIVVDDCSTDKTCEIVESYIHRGGDFRVKLFHTPKNSGGPGLPTNIGLKKASGKYILFVGNDDAITKTALEELFNLAEKFQADVVHCEKHIHVPESWHIGDENYLQVSGAAMGKFVTEPTWVTENFAERAVALRNYQFDWAPFNRLIRRDFLTENKIDFANTSAEDVMFTCCLVCSAKKYLRVPNIVNFVRVRGDSLSHHVERNVEKLVAKWVNALIVGFDYVDKFLSRQKYFQEHLDAKYIVLDTIVSDFSRYLLEMYAQIPAFRLDALIRQEFAKSKNLTPLTSFLFSRMNIFQVNLIQQQNLIQQLQEQLAMRNA